MTKIAHAPPLRACLSFLLNAGHLPTVRTTCQQRLAQWRLGDHVRSGGCARNTSRRTGSAGGVGSRTGA